jgi:hypothetical protein
MPSVDGGSAHNADIPEAGHNSGGTFFATRLLCAGHLAERSYMTVHRSAELGFERERHRGRVELAVGAFVVIGVDGHGLTVFESFDSDDFEQNDVIEGLLRSPGIHQVVNARTGRFARGCVEIVDGQHDYVINFLIANGHPELADRD